MKPGLHANDIRQASRPQTLYLQRWMTLYGKRRIGQLATVAWSRKLEMEGSASHLRRRAYCVEGPYLP
jgi:hypothetical protein